MSVASRHAKRIKEHEEYLKAENLRAKFGVKAHVTDSGDLWVNGITISPEHAVALANWILEVFE